MVLSRLRERKDDGRGTKARSVFVAAILVPTLLGVMTGCSKSASQSGPVIASGPSIAPPPGTADKILAANPNMSPQAKEAMERELQDMGSPQTSGKKQ